MKDSHFDSPELTLIRVLRPRTLRAGTLPAERIPLGIPDDYKSCIARFPGGALWVVAFHQVQLGEGRVREDMITFSSQDGGRTWSERQVVGLVGREPYFSVLDDGMVFITTHLLEQDIRNCDGYTHSYVHRSPDGGATWKTMRIGVEDLPDAPASKWVVTSRNIIRLQDGTVILGVSAPGGLDYLWRSPDGGKTWDKTACSTFHGVDKAKLWWPFWGEAFLWQTRCGDLLAILRVDPRILPPLPGLDSPDYSSYTDSVERMVVYRSRDGGHNWYLDEPLGSVYAEMYPALLRLQDRRLLLTFTVRDLHPPLGVHAVLGVERDDGFTFDFAHDRLILEAKTPLDKPSGGGFGPTVQLDDGGLVTAYSYRGADDRTRLEVVRWRLP